MGCDIHMFVETETGADDGPDWQVRQFANRWDRNYGLFAHLAGVRNYGNVEPIAEPRGLPHDISAAGRALYAQDEDDAHSTSWLTVGEIRAHEWGDMGPWQKEVDRFMEWLPRWEGDRLVFWFDN
jgi:hypothetical protein